MSSSANIMFLLVLLFCGGGTLYHTFYSDAGSRSKLIILLIYLSSWLVEWMRPETSWCLFAQTLLSIYIVFHFQYIEN